jgi:mxaK protein
MGLTRGFSRRRATHVAWSLLAVLAGWAGVEIVSLVHIERLNAQISAGSLPIESPGARSELRFAQAAALAASGAADAALNRYGALHDDPRVGLAARYNSANLLLRQGMALQQGAQPGQALALIELAKEGYREVLRQDGDHWAARYNLERAQRLVPDPDDADEEPPDLKRNAERAATTMRGYSPGMP